MKIEQVNPEIESEIVERNPQLSPDQRLKIAIVSLLNAGETIETDNLARITKMFNERQRGLFAWKRLESGNFSIRKV